MYIMNHFDEDIFEYVNWKQILDWQINDRGGYHKNTISSIFRARYLSNEKRKTSNISLKNGFIRNKWY